MRRDEARLNAKDDDEKEQMMKMKKLVAHFAILMSTCGANHGEEGASLCCFWYCIHVPKVRSIEGADDCIAAAVAKNDSFDHHFAAGEV